MNSEGALFLVALSWVAAMIHGVVAVPHFDEYTAYGVAFVVVAAFQAVWGVVAWRDPSRPVLMSAIVVNLGVVAVWAWSRTLGLPIGPEPGQVEAVGFADLGSTFAELSLVAGCAWALARPDRLWHVPVAARQFAMVALMFAGVALMTAGHHHG